MTFFPDLLPAILRQDACEILAFPKAEHDSRQDYSVRISVGKKLKRSSKEDSAIELDEIRLNKDARRKDPIFAVHQNNVTLSRSDSRQAIPVTHYSYIDKTICLLLDNLNRARRVQGLQALVLNPELCEHAEFHANSTACPSMAVLPGPAYKIIRARHLGIPKANTKVERVIFTGKGWLEGARHGIRLTSAEGLGALSCSELWLSGKYKKHVYPVRSSADHPPNCGCAEWAAYRVVMDSERHLVGVARDPFGRFVVEFLDPELW